MDTAMMLLLMTIAAQGDEVACKSGEMGLGQIVLSPDGKRFAFAVNEGKWDKGCVVVDGKKGEEFNAVENFLWSPDGKRLAHAALKRANFENVRRFAVVDGRAVGEFDEVRDLAFSRGGERFACVGVYRRKVVVLLGGRPIAGLDWVDTIRFGGKTLRIGGRKGGEHRWRSVPLE